MKLRWFFGRKKGQASPEYETGRQQLYPGIKYHVLTHEIDKVRY